MRDDYRYSVEREVLYRHPEPGGRFFSYGESGPERTWGIILDVKPDPMDPDGWVYTIRNRFNAEVREVPEDDILCGAGLIHRRAQSPHALMEGESGQGAAPDVLRSNLARFVRTDISRLKEQEEMQAIARAEGSNLPLDAGDYVRISGEFRKEIEPYDGYYARILEVRPAEIGALELDPGKWGGQRTFRVQKHYVVQTEDGARLDIYDPEIKRFYTSQGRSAVLNWRAAIFLAEVFGDEAPYHVDFDYLDSHLFTRDELKDLPREKLADILVDLLYVKGQLTLQDREAKLDELRGASVGYLVDNILFDSRFDMRRNRPMTHEEISEHLQEQNRLRKAFGG